MLIIILVYTSICKHYSLKKVFYFRKLNIFGSIGLFDLKTKDMLLADRGFKSLISILIFLLLSFACKDKSNSLKFISDGVCFCFDIFIPLSIISNFRQCHQVYFEHIFLDQYHTLERYLLM